MKDERGETRRERNERFDTPSPPLVIPEFARHIWDWYQELSDGSIRIFDGVCHPIPWTEFQAWSALTGHIVLPSEYDILRAMDKAFCSELNKEFEAYRERQKSQGK